MIKMRRVILLFLLFTGIVRGYTQDIEYARFIVKTLSSDEFKGRGYVGKGDKEAADFIVEQFKKYRLISFGKTYLQKYSFPINTFPGKMEVAVDNLELIPGKDYVVSLASKGVNATYELEWLINDSIAESSRWVELSKLDLSQKLVVTDKFHKNLAEANLLNAAGYIFIKDSNEVISWKASNGRILKDFLVMDIRKEKLEKTTQRISISFKNKYEENYQTQNIIGMIRGIACPDTFVVISAHYDHLGMMGEKTIYPGANDNASGVSMMLDLARHFSLPGNEPYYSIVFMAFSGEEAGLMGSNYYVEHPLFPLSQIKFLINLDMVGSGSKGIGLVNGQHIKRASQLIQQLNEKGKYLPEVALRGESKNSDHFPFYNKGVSCFFIYTMGEEWPYYHTPEDACCPPFTAYIGLFDLLKEFIVKVRFL